MYFEFDKKMKVLEVFHDGNFRINNFFNTLKSYKQVNQIIFQAKKIVFNCPVYYDYLSGGKFKVCKNLEEIEFKRGIVTKNKLWVADMFRLTPTNTLTIFVPSSFANPYGNLDFHDIEKSLSLCKRTNPADFPPKIDVKAIIAAKDKTDENEEFTK